MSSVWPYGILLVDFTYTVLMHLLLPCLKLWDDTFDVLWELGLLLCVVSLEEMLNKIIGSTKQERSVL